jgi:N-carbamoyl-L-amino-acid hydrolase
MKKMYSDIKAFLELHIEQGQRLENSEISMAIINRVVGTYRSKVKIIGEANHSGTTMMENRKDALAAAAEMILEVEMYCKTEGDVVGTVGTINISPNAANIIPGQVDFILEIRAETEAAIQKAVAKIRFSWDQIVGRRKVKMIQEVFLDQKPVALDQGLVTLIENTAKDLNEPCLILPSMAVHDAAHMASITKSVMVFVKSIGGKSHCPEEFSKSEDIEKAGNLLLNSIVRLDQMLSEEFQEEKRMY